MGDPAPELKTELEAKLLEQVEAAIAADAATMRAGRYRIPQGENNACAALVAELSDAERRAVTWWILDPGHRYVDHSLHRAREDSLAGALGRRRIAWSAQDAEAFFGMCFEWLEAPAGTGVGVPSRRSLGFALAAAEAVDGSDLAGLVPALTKLRDQVNSGSSTYPLTAASVLRRVGAALERARNDDGPALPEGFLLHSDLFGPKILAELAEDLTDSRFVALMLHCAALSTVRPSQKWMKQYRELADAIPARSASLPPRVLTMLLEHESTDFQRLPWVDGHICDGHGPCTYCMGWGPVFLGAPVADFVRALVWGYASTAGVDAVPLLSQVAEFCSQIVRATAKQKDAKVSGAAIAALGTIGGDPAVACLRRIQTAVRHKNVQKAVAAALDDAALRAGLTPQQVVERSVPNHDVDFVADLDAVYKTVLGSKDKEVKKTLQIERDRLEGLLAADLRWTGSEWSAYYVGHPLTGAHARRLVWEASADGGQSWFAGVPSGVPSGTPSVADGAWQLDGLDGATHLVAPDDTIRLWHPVHHTVADIHAWRERFTEREFRQPFKQIFREIYLLTPAEVATASYSNRFAAHILHANQAKALSITRGWSGLQVGPWSSGYEAEAVKEFAGTGWRARFFVALVIDEDNRDASTLCSTDQVRFERRQGRAWRAADLVDVPACVLSEAFRDVDLFVGVAGIAADPEWVDRGDTAHHAYWHRQSFGDLNQAAQDRRAALARLLPRTKIADRVELADRFLRVRGDLRTYKIHLGSGNILMEPDDAYLCVVGARKSAASRVFLPFEEDGGLLSMIVSKAFLLAADTKISDPTIGQQLRR